MITPVGSACFFNYSGLECVKVKIAITWSIIIYYYNCQCLLRNLYHCRPL